MHVVIMIFEHVKFYPLLVFKYMYVVMGVGGFEKVLLSVGNLRLRVVKNPRALMCTPK